MSLHRERIHYLLDAYISKRANVVEENELMDWILMAEEDCELKNYMLEIWNQYEPVKDFSSIDWNKIYAHAIQSPVVSIEPKVRKMRWSRFAAAAIVLIVLTVGIYFYSNPHTQPPVTKNETKQNDIPPPSGNKAILTLANGTKIEIDSSGNGTLAVQGSVKVIKKSNGEISYAGTAKGEVTYNTLNVPRGSKPLKLMLSDGTLVWLNVGSSLTYPTAFKGNEREVKITGEAYFEVAHNAKMPFVVHHNDVAVRVLGTHFNVNTYEDEPAEKITLLQGAVRVTRNLFSQLLKPGQQAQINNNDSSRIKVWNDVNIDEVIAWKDGKFRFDRNTDISTIMREISRWYNVDVEYEGKINQRFWGSISKDVNVSEVLKILEATGAVKFKVERNKITVMPVSN